MTKTLLLFLGLLLSQIVLSQTPLISPAGPIKLCSGSSQTLSVTGYSPGATFQWTKDGSDLSGATKENYTVTDAGTYNVKVNGTTLTDVLVTVVPKPKADFSFTAPTTCGKPTISFSNQSTDGLTYAWDFGDGKSSTVKDPSNKFDPGVGSGNKSFSVKLTVTNSDGCTDEITKTVTVGQYPDATLRSDGLTDLINGEPYFKRCAATGQTFTFWSNSSTSSSNTKYVIKWGDGSQDAISNTQWVSSSPIKHDYSVGQKKLTYLVYRDGCVDSTVYIIFVGNVPAGGITGTGGSTLCTGSDQEFVISGTANNPSGTTYEINYGDGTATVFYNHPAPDNIKHTYPKSSCKTTSSSGNNINYQNAFGTYITIVNPCGRASGSIVPIYVSDKPDADFTVEQYICENLELNVKNTGQFGNNVENGVCTEGKLAWVVRSATPGASWTITSGSTGNTDNEINPQYWTSGTKEFKILFKSKGIYTITQYMANNTLCGQDSMMKTIYVNPTPGGAASFDATEGCAPFTVKATGSTTNSPVFGSNTFKWTVTYGATTGCSPTTSGFSYVGGTSENSQNPQFQFTNPGEYTVKLVVSAPGGACSGTEITKIIKVKGKPNISLKDIPSSACENLTFSPSATVSCYTNNATYAWTFTGASPSSSSQLSPGQISYTRAGDYTVNLSATNECGTSTVSSSVSVKQTPAVTIPDDIVVCNGQLVGPLNFSSSVSGASIGWSNSAISIGLGISGTGNIAAFTAKNTGTTPVTAVITVSSTSGSCKSMEKTMKITVNPSPKVSVNSPSICSGTSETLTASGADTYTWSPSTGLSATTGSSVTANPTVTTTYVVTGKVTSTGCSVSADAKVTVKPVPSITAASSNPTSCGSTTGSIEISGLASGTYAVNYSRDGQPQTSLSRSPIGGKITLSNLRAGVYSDISVTIEGCTSNKLGPISLSDPSAPEKPTITYSGPVCEGTALTFTIQNYQSNTTYNWRGPSSFSQSSTSSSVTRSSTIAAHSGKYTVVAVVSGCTSPAGEVDAVVNPKPVLTVNSETICSGNSVDLKVSGADSYTWSPSGGLDKTSGDVVKANPTSTTTYTVTGVFTTTGCSATKTSKVDVKPTPSITGLASDPTKCATNDGKITISGLTANASYTVNYKKDGVGQTLSRSANSVGEIALINLSPATYADLEVLLSGCPSNKIGPFILKDPTPPTTPLLTSNSPVCSGETINLKVDNAAPNATFAWTGPAGFSKSGTSATESRSAALVTHSGTYSVTMTVSGCTSPAGTVEVKVNPKPSVTVNSGFVCSGNSIELKALGADTYSWSPTSGLSQSTGDVVKASPTASTDYTVTGVFTATGCSSTATSKVEVRPTPNITGSFSSPTKCGTADGSISISGLTANTTYSVRYKKDGVAQTTSLRADAAGVILIANLSGGVYSMIEVVLNECPSNQIGPFELKDPTPPAAPTLNSNSPVCSGNELTITVSNPVSGATFNWTGPNGFATSTTGATLSRTNTTVAMGGVYGVRMVANNCASEPANITVLVNQTPPAPGVSPMIYCQNATATALIALPASGNTLLWYSTATGGSGSTTAPVPSTTSIGTTSYYVSQKTVEGCEGPRAELKVTVNTTPNVPDQARTVCNGATFSIQPSGMPTGIEYTWGMPELTGGITGGAAGTGTSITGTLVNPTDQPQTATYTVLTKLGSCLGNTFKAIVTVNPAPFVPKQSAIICSGETFSLTIRSGDPGVLLPAGTLFTWTSPSVSPAGTVTGLSAQTSGAASIAQTLVNQTNRKAVVTYTVTPKVSSTGGCEGAPFEVIVTVNPKPKISNKSVIICSGTSFTVRPQDNAPAEIVPDNTTYTWTTPTVTPAGAITGGIGQSVPQREISQKLINTTTSPATVTYTVSPVSGVDGNCAGEPFTVVVTVNPQPNIADVETTICHGGEFNVVPSNVPSNTTYTWGIPVSDPTGAINGGSAQAVAQSSIRQRLFNTTNIPARVVYAVRPTAGACDNATFNVTVILNPAPQIPAQSETICNNGIFTIDPRHTPRGTIVPVGTTYTWTTPVSSPAGAITGGFAQGIPQPVITQQLSNTTAAPATLTYMVTPVSGAEGRCAGLAFPVVVAVNPDAQARISVKEDTACYPFRIEKDNLRNISPATISADFNWYADGVLIGSGRDFPGYTINSPLDSVTIKMVMSSKGGCKPDSIVHRFFTKRKPDASFRTSTNGGCGPLTVSFENTSTFDPGFTYSWNFGNGQTSRKYSPDAVVFLSNPNYSDTIYKVILTVFNDCDTITEMKEIRVSAIPLARFTPSKAVGCSPMTVSFNNTSLGFGNRYIWNFGDGISRLTTSRDTIQHTYYSGVRDTLDVQLIAINDCGADTSEFKIVISPNAIKLDVAVTGIEQNGCAPHTVTFYNNSSGAGQFRWDFGDGNIRSTTRNIDTIQHTFLSPGNYQVKIFATNTCSDTSTSELINVYAKPISDFTPSDFEACVGDSIRFTNTSTGGNEYLWTFGDGNTSLLVNPRHKFARPGLYLVTLTTNRVNAPGSVCSSVIQKVIRIVDSLKTDFDMSASLGTCLPFEVKFRSSFSGAARVEWDFGDGSKGFGASATHTYRKSGVYYPKLLIIADGGCVYTAEKRVDVKAPEGTIRIDTSVACGVTPVRFEAVPINADTIIWDFGDGQTLMTTERVIYHRYLNPGIYLPKARFKGSGGCVFDVPDVYQVKVDRIVAGFRTLKQEDCGTTTVKFSDTSNVFFGKAAVSWRFGDGTTASGASATKTFDLTNRYLIQQIITGVTGCTDTTEIPVDVFVRSIPDAEILITEPICTGKEVLFKAFVQSNDSITAYNWQISNGIRSDKPSFSATFATPNTYSVRFITATRFGCYDTATASITVHPTPVVRAAPDVTICKGSNVQLSASGASTYSWYPGNGLSCVNCPTPVATPDLTTTYTVKGTSSAGCFAYDTVLVKVIQPFKIKVAPSDSICIGDSYLLLASGAARYQWSPSVGLNRDDISNPVATPSVTTIYRVVGFDEFNCFTDTGFVTVGVGLYPKIDLGPDTLLATGSRFSLRSIVVNGPIRDWRWSPSADLSCTTCSEPIALIRKDITYSVMATTYFGCSGRDTINIRTFCKDAQVYIPNGFSPDGDGINDVFMVRGSGIMQVKSIRVFSRWGDIVFERTNVLPNDVAAGWDGRVRGVIKGPDVFAYTVEVICDNGTPYVFKGNVTLLK